MITVDSNELSPAIVFRGSLASKERCYPMELVAATLGGPDLTVASRFVSTEEPRIENPAVVPLDSTEITVKLSMGFLSQIEIFLFFWISWILRSQIISHSENK